MDNIFRKSENSKASDSHRLLLNLSDKIDLKISDKYVALKMSYKKINLKYQLQRGTKNLYYLMDHSLYQIFIIILSISSIKHETFTYNPPIKIYVNQIKNTITFRMKTVYYLELLTSETMKLLRSTKSKITKDENGGNVPHLEITELVLVHCNIVNNEYQQDSRVLHTFVPNKSFAQLLDISPRNFVFLKTFSSEFSNIEIRFTDQNS